MKHKHAWELGAESLCVVSQKSILSFLCRLQHRALNLFLLVQLLFLLCLLFLLPLPSSTFSLLPVPSPTASLPPPSFIPLRVERHQMQQGPQEPPAPPTLPLSRSIMLPVQITLPLAVVPPYNTEYQLKSCIWVLAIKPLNSNRYFLWLSVFFCEFFLFFFMVCSLCCRVFTCPAHIEWLCVATVWGDGENCTLNRENCIKRCVW